MKLDKKVSWRVNGQQYRDFAMASKNVHGREPQSLLREIMVAVTEGRVKITPTDEQLKTIRQSTELYHVN